MNSMNETSWTRPPDILAQVRKLWDSGRLLTDRLEDGIELFPLKLRLRKATSRDLDERFEAVRDWVGELIEHSKTYRGHGYEIEWRTVNHRLRGSNQLPAAAVVNTSEDALRLISKTTQAQRFDQLCQALLSELPALHDWLARRPLEALKREAEWPRLVAILRHFLNHPRPGVYLRQLDIPGVDTKFIQTRRGMVGALLVLGRYRHPRLRHPEPPAPPSARSPLLSHGPGHPRRPRRPRPRLGAGCSPGRRGRAHRRRPGQWSTYSKWQMAGLLRNFRKAGEDCPSPGQPNMEML